MLAVLAGAWIVACGAQLAVAYGHAHAGEQTAASARRAIGSGGLGLGQAEARLDQARRSFALAHRRASSPVLAPLRVAPVVGRQVQSFAQLSKAASLVTGVAATSAEAVGTLLGGGGTAGTERVATLQALAERAATAHAALGLVPVRGGRGLVEPLRRRWAALGQEVTSTRASLRTAADGLRGVSEVLQGPRRYLLLAANNAEMRAGSGMFLSVGTIETAGGSVRVGALRPSGDLRLPGPGAPVAGDLADRWGRLAPGREWRNLGTTPRFDVTAPLALDMWERLTGERLDGVLAVDVPFLAAILAATGPVAVADGVVSEATVVDRLLRDQYAGVDVDDAQAERRDELGAIAAAVVGALDHGDYSPWRLAAELARAGRGRHVLAWSAAPAAQRTWETLGVAGALGADALAVNVLNRGGNKLDPFLDVDAAMGLGPASEGTEVTVRVTVANRTPPGQSRYIAGPHPSSGVGKGDYLGIVTVNVPGAATELSVDGAHQTLANGPDGPTQVVAVPLLLGRDEESAVTVRFRLPPGHRQLQVVPSARVPAVRWEAGDRHWHDDATKVVRWRWE